MITQGLGSIISSEPQYSQLQQALVRVGEPPCTKAACPLYAACAGRQLACRDFFNYVEGAALTGEREPTRALYELIFKQPEGCA